MPSRICERCNKEYSSGASYRVHKSRYHRLNSIINDVIKQEEALVQTNSELEKTPEPSSSSTPNPLAPKSREVEGRGGSNDGLLIAGGVVAVIIAILLGGRK